MKSNQNNNINRKLACLLVVVPAWVVSPAAAANPAAADAKHRFWKHHASQKTLLVNGVDQWDNMESCLVQQGLTPHVRQQLVIPAPDPQVAMTLREDTQQDDDDDNEQQDEQEQQDGQIYFVALHNAMTPIQAQAVQWLATCIQQHVPSLYNPARALYKEFGLEEDDGFGGNTPTVLNPIMSIFLPEVVEVVYQALELAYDEAQWNVLTQQEQTQQEGEVEHPHPLPRDCGIRVAEHLSYDNFRSLAGHDDGYGGTSYTVNFALSAADEYEGGEVFVISNTSNKKFHYKPDKYGVMAFLGGEFIHGVEDITSGHRELFSSEFWSMPDAPLGNTLAETQPQHMRAYMTLCDEVGGDDPCLIPFSEAMDLYEYGSGDEEEEGGLDDGYDEELYNDESDHDDDDDEEEEEEEGEYSYEEFVEEEYDEDEEEDDEDEEEDDVVVSNTLDFRKTTLAPLEIEPLQWKDDDGIVAQYAFRAGLPATLTQKVRDYCDRMGITDEFRRLLVEGEAAEPDSKTANQFNGFNWFTLRPDTRWASNMHWIGPDDHEAHRDMLEVMSEGGFDSLLELLGQTFDLDGIAVYHVGFMAVSKCERGFVHSDFTRTGGKGWHIIFPLMQANDTGPDLTIFADDGSNGGYKYEEGVGCIVGDDVPHATATLDYFDTKEMRITASIYLADVNEDNAESIADEYSATDLPEGDPEYLMTQAGIHWSRTDRSRRLPQAGTRPGTHEPPTCSNDNSNTETCLEAKEE